MRREWLTCAGCAVALFCVSGLSINAFTVYQPFMTEAGRLCGAESSGVIAARSLFCLASTLAAGPAYRMVPLRAGLVGAMAVEAAGFVLFAFADDFWAYCIAAAVVGIAYGFGTMIPVAMIIGRRFNRGGTAALGVCGAATGLSTIGVPSLITAGIGAFGLQKTFLGEAAVIAILGVVCFLLVGRVPAGARPCPRVANYPDARSSVEHRERDALDARAWVALSFMLLALGAMTSTGFSHLALLASSEGFDPEVVAVAVSAAGCALLAGKLLFGWAAERFGTYRCTWAFGAIVTIGLATLCISDGSELVLFAGMLAYGGGLAVTTVGLTVWAADLSMGAEYDRTVWRFQAGYAFGGFVSSPVPGVLADSFGGSYVPAYALFILCSAFVIAVVQAVYHLYAPKTFRLRRDAKIERDACASEAGA